MSKRVLAVLSEWGYWGIELVGPLSKLESAGYTFDFVTPNGKRSPVLAPSTDPDFVDGPLGRKVTTREDAAMVIAFEASGRIDHPLSLAELFPERPYVSAPDYLARLEEYCQTRREAQANAVATYAAVLIVGGSGPILDIANNRRVHDLVLGFVRADKPVAAICYGVATLAFAREFTSRTSILAGKHVTGHCLEYDYVAGTRVAGLDADLGPPPYPLEYILADAVKPSGCYHGNFGERTSVVVDFPFITARSLQCSHEFGDRMVDVLTKGLTRHGW